MNNQVKYDFLFSYADVEVEKRYVSEIYKKLKDYGYKIFFDALKSNKEIADSITEELKEFLRNKYMNEGKFCVIFHSDNYNKHQYTKVELKAALEKMLNDFPNYVIVIKMDNAQLPKQLEGKIRLDKRTNKIKDIVDILHKFYEKYKYLESVENHNKWITAAYKNPEQKVINNTDCVWLRGHLVNALIDDVKLEYEPPDSNKSYKKSNEVLFFLNGMDKDIKDVYEKCVSIHELKFIDGMKRDIKKVYINWFKSMEKEEKDRLSELIKEDWGLQVRLKRKHYDHEGCTILFLSPMKYIYYLSILRRMYEPELRNLRNEVLINILKFNKGSSLLLPSNFAIHMAIVTKDNKALLRQRSSETELYPEAWEAGIGEFMHGPSYNKEGEYPHFSEGEPNLSLYLRNAVKEELGYTEEKEDCFRLYGFAIEYLTLAPKLIVVYNSSGTSTDIAKTVTNAKDKGRAHKWPDFTINELVSAFKDKEKYPSWGPTSKLALILSLTQGKTETQKKGILEIIKQRMKDC